MSHSPEQNRKKSEALRQADAHKNVDVTGEMSDEEVRKKTDTGKYAFWNGSDTPAGMQQRRNYMKQHPEHFKE